MAVLAAIIQARNGSTRLPGKVTKKVGNETVLGVLIERLKGSEEIERIIVATTERAEDDSIEEIALAHGADVFRGSEKDILDRFHEAAKRFDVDIIARITADNPFTDVGLLDKMSRTLIAESYDYISAEGLALGLGSEVFTFRALERAWENSKERYCREHVTPYIYEHRGDFKIGVYRDIEPIKKSEVRLTIDTGEDLEVYRRIYEHFGDLISTDIEDVIEFLEKHPEVRDINKKIVQKNYREAED